MNYHFSIVELVVKRSSSTQGQFLRVFLPTHTGHDNDVTHTNPHSRFQHTTPRGLNHTFKMFSVGGMS